MARGTKYPKAGLPTPPPRRGEPPKPVMTGTWKNPKGTLPTGGATPGKVMSNAARRARQAAPIKGAGSKPVVISPAQQAKRVAYAKRNPTFKPVMGKQGLAGRVKVYKPK